MDENANADERVRHSLLAIPNGVGCPKGGVDPMNLKIALVGPMETEWEPGLRLDILPRSMVFTQLNISPAGGLA